MQIVELSAKGERLLHPKKFSEVHLPHDMTCTQCHTVVRVEEAKDLKLDDWYDPKSYSSRSGGLGFHCPACSFGVYMPLSNTDVNEWKLEVGYDLVFGKYQPHHVHAAAGTTLIFIVLTILSLVLH